MHIFRKQQTDSSNDDSEKLIRARDMSEKFDLKEQVDEDSLDEFWNRVEQDIQNDPDWFKFSQ